MTENTTIPLNKLRAWEGNVRKTEADKGIDELAASIASHGLLQSLVVRKDRRGKFAVVAGQRRLLALQSLAEVGRIADAMPIPCAIIEAHADAEEISLAENVQREAMHPADEFEAFKAMIDKGTPPADVAARFGVTESVVQKRLKLAKVSPALIAAYRAGEMTLQHVMAFTVTDDHKLQERVWNDLADWQKEDPEVIYDLLTEDEVTAKDRRVKFVGLEAYERAGGKLRRDLFSDGEDGVFIEDAALLENLVAQKLETIAATVLKAGWKWVRVCSTFDPQEWSKYGRVHAEPATLPPEKQTELDALQAEHEALWEFEETTEEQDDRIAELAELIHQIEDRECVWSPEVLGSSGVIITLGFDGEADIHEGYVRPEDRRNLASHPADEIGKGKLGSVGLPASLVESLTAHHSAAINAELIRHPDIALATLVTVFASQVFYSCGREDSTLQIAVFGQPLHRAEGSPARATVEAERDEWWGKLPAFKELLPWCLRQEQDQLLRLLAYCTAQTVDTVKTKQPHNGERVALTEALVAALDVDITKWFTPTAENYFSKVSKAQILDALRQANGDIAPAWASMKKAELAALAERKVAGTGWLPEPLRTAPKTGD